MTVLLLPTHTVAVDVTASARRDLAPGGCALLTC
jgi:hypothetical protein